MLRKLARLTRPVPAAGPRALAIAIYSDPPGDLVTAPGEGVACVDDAARAIDLLAAVWLATGAQRIREWAGGLLDFVLWMHQGDGVWLNFISSWSGELNLRGATSVPGINFWQARAVGAAVTGALILGDARALPIAELGLAAAAASTAPSDVRSLHVLAQQRLLVAGSAGGGARVRLKQWADEIAATRIGDTLMNSLAESGSPHLWGHFQEAALAAAAAALDRPALTAVAEASAMAFFAPVIESSFDLPRVQPYDVRSAVCAMDALAAATGQLRYQQLAALGREWFHGRNPARSPVYDRASGAVADGIDGAVVSSNSGAESNVEGGLALLQEAIASASLAL